MPDSISLVLLPPPDIATLIDPLRSANDKSFARGWSAHITILFPFAPATGIAEVARTLRDALSERDAQPFIVTLDKVSGFATRDYETVYLGVLADEPIQDLWRLSAKVLKHPKDEHQYIPHLTLGQTARNPASISFLTEKAKAILSKRKLSWQVDSVALMRRRQGEETLEMYEQIPIGRNGAFVPRPYGIAAGTSCHFDGDGWVPRQPTATSKMTLSLATYNVLHDSSFPSMARFSALRDAIAEANVDVICLQEVTDDFLWEIMADTKIRNHFRWCSRADNAVMESERNVVILAREIFGFEATRVELGGNHKAAVVVRIHTSQGAVAIAGIHLTAGKTEPTLNKKRTELSALAAYLHLHHASDEWVVAGDTNWPDSEAWPLEEELKDVWEQSGGGTYDPTTNILAAATARENRDPQRYDRIFIKRAGVLSVTANGSRLFGLPPSGQTPASDHWGLAVDLVIGKQVAPVPPAQEARAPPLSILPTTLTDSELGALCAEQEFLPSLAHNEKFTKAVSALRNLLSDASPTMSDDLTAPSSDGAPVQTSPSTTSPVRLIVAPVGSFAMGCHNVDSDVDCVVVGNISSSTFWSLMRLKIRSATTAQSVGSVRLRRFVKHASVPMMELDVDGVKMDVQYCPAGKLIDCWSDLANIPRDSPLFSLPVSVLRTLNAHRDALALQQALPSLNNFRLAHRSLKLFFKSHGLTGARFGYLGGCHVSVLLARICILLPPSASVPQIIRVFFNTYAHWDWEHDMVTVPIPGTTPTSYRRNIGREPLCILSIEKSVVNMTINGNQHSLAVIKNELALADRNLDNGLPWKEVCMGQNSSPLMDFLQHHKAFVKIDVNYWGSSCMKGRALVGWLESRFVNLLVHLHAEVPLIHVRLWPFRLSDSNVVDDKALQGFYLIGLTSTSNQPKTEEGKQLTRQEHAKSLSALTGTLRTFESELHQNSRYYDPMETFISVTNIGPSQVPPSVVVDLHTWSDDGFDEEDDSEDDEDDLESAHDNLESRPMKKPEKEKTAHVLAPKLRTSSDVYNRLMWDPSVSSSDYAIGYEDRFKGVKEMPLGSWKREVEDEAFIPFHRVVYFRRKSDNILVWDRKTKTDLLFSGSGVPTSPK